MSAPCDYRGMHIEADKGLFRELVDDHRGLVARIASAYEAREDLAEELVQDVFLAVWRALDRFRGDAGLRTYVARIAHNVCASHVRKAVRRKTVQLEDQHLEHVPSAETDAGELDYRLRLLAAIRSLPLPDRQLVTLHLEGFSNREIAETLDLSEGNVAVRLTRVRAKLKTKLEVGNES